jgi:hypothetical protein
MKFNLSLLARLVMAAAWPAAVASRWIGMTPDPAAPSVVNLFLLNNDGSPGATFGSVQLSAAERVDVDAFRCRPYGVFCVFSTTDRLNTSWLYNVSAFTGAVSSRTPLPGIIIHNLSIDMADGSSYTVALGPGWNRTAAVVRILEGQVTTVLDLTDQMCDTCTIAPGATTQCSNDGSMWVGIRSGSDAPDRLVQLNLQTRTLVNVTQLAQPMLAALWASCDDETNVNEVGGATLLSNGTVAAYGRLLADGSFVADSTSPLPAGAPPNLRLTGLLSEPETFDYFMALYPDGEGPGSAGAQGWFAFGNFGAGASLSFQPQAYYLTGAAVLS